MNSNMILIFVSLLSVLCLSAPGSVSIASGQGEMTDVKVLERGNDWQCPSMEERERARNEIHQITASVIANISTLTTMATLTTTTALTTTLAVTTTSATTMPSVTGPHTCNGTPGWRRVAFINMTDTSYNCPTGLRLTSYSKRTCGRSHTNSFECSSTTFSVEDLPHSRVCGRIRGYQFGATSGFHSSISQGIDGYYVDGISLTRGGAGSRQHIWTFAAKVSEVITSYPYFGCPCGSVPSFIENDYFCESGLHSIWNHDFVFYPNDVLWDGQNCASNSTCCQLNYPPWFRKNLPSNTTDDIELRICTDSPPSSNDVPIELVELYVQ